MPKESNSVDFEEKYKAELLQSTSRDDLKDATWSGYFTEREAVITNQEKNELFISDNRIRSCRRFRS
jgi:hypothetical protein